MRFGHLILVCVFLINCIDNGLAKPLPSEKGQHIIIDTDCAIDDFRAISLILARPEISIEAITTCDGTLTPAEGYQKVMNLLNAFGRDTIPVTIGIENPSIQPDWRKFNQRLDWGGAQQFEPGSGTAVELIRNTLLKSDDRITLVCLGPLTNIARIADETTLHKHIRQIVWYNEGQFPLKEFNFDSDTLAANRVLQSGIKMVILSNLNNLQLRLDTTFEVTYEKATTFLGKTMTQAHSQPEANQLLASGHFWLNDELAAIYLTDPELFDITPDSDHPYLRIVQNLNASAIHEVFADMISGKYIPQSGVVLRDFPTDRNNYAYDVRPIMDEAMRRHGVMEWKAVVMTDEFHGHLGVFSIVGAKMGTLARIYFGVGYDELEVVSSAGSKPPYSCLNDGIQVSTGATLGMGTISLSAENLVSPSAVFMFEGRAIRLSLKKEYLEKIDSDIREGIVKFGVSDDGYWKLVRRNAIRYWLEWGRNEIFELEIISK